MLYQYSGISNFLSKIKEGRSEIRILSRYTNNSRQLNFSHLFFTSYLSNMAGQSAFLKKEGWESASFYINFNPLSLKNQGSSGKSALIHAILNMARQPAFIHKISLMTGQSAFIHKLSTMSRAIRAHP